MRIPFFVANALARFALIRRALHIAGVCVSVRHDYRTEVDADGWQVVHPIGSKQAYIGVKHADI